MGTQFSNPLKKRILVLGAGFGGLELSTMLSEALGGDIDVTLIDKGDAFYFGFSKLDVMFGYTTRDAVMLPYGKILKPGVRFLQETISSIDPIAKRVTGGRARCRLRFRGDAGHDGGHRVLHAGGCDAVG
jgi:sulfide:quinone oxidoreductase